MGIKKQLNSSSNLDEYMMTWECAEKYFAELESQSWSKVKLERAKKRLAVFYADLSEDKLISENTVRLWKEILQERGLSERTIKEYISVVSQFMDFIGYHNFSERRGKPKNLQGQIFGELQALEPVKGKKSEERSIIWKCRCSCGREVEIPANQLARGNHTSCGCKKVERLKEINRYIDGTSLKMVFSDTIRKDNTSGCKGVFRKRDQWGVRIQYKGKRYYLGSYSKLEEAISVRKDAEEKIREDAESLLIYFENNRGEKEYV